MFFFGSFEWLLEVSSDDPSCYPLAFRSSLPLRAVAAPGRQPYSVVVNSEKLMTSAVTHFEISC
jgi:hypothetical protein